MNHSDRVREITEATIVFTLSLSLLGFLLFLGTNPEVSLGLRVFFLFPAIFLPLPVVFYGGLLSNFRSKEISEVCQTKVIKDYFKSLFKTVFGLLGILGLYKAQAYLAETNPEMYNIFFLGLCISAPFIGLFLARSVMSLYSITRNQFKPGPSTENELGLKVGDAVILKSLPESPKLNIIEEKETYYWAQSSNLKERIKIVKGEEDK